MTRTRAGSSFAMLMTLLLSLVLVWAGAMPAHAQVEQPAYVAMGDSYSSGEGACNQDSNSNCAYITGTDTSKDQCHRSKHSYPWLLGTTKPKNWTFHFTACSGAVTDNINSSGRSTEASQGNQLVAIEQRPHTYVRLITLTIGGNDEGFSTIVTNCFARDKFKSGSCKPKPALSTSAFTDRLRRTYVNLHRIAPRARIIVLGYPQLFSARAVDKVNGKNNCQLNAASARDMSSVEKSVNGVIASTVGNLNAAMKKAGRAPYLTYLSNDATFAGHELCRPEVKNAGWINRIMFNGAPRPESCHPDTPGHQALFTRLPKNLFT